MASVVKLKKSSVLGKVPLTTDLDFGELALNYTDGKLYYKKSDGTTIDYFQSGASGGGGGTSVTVSDTAPASPSANALWWDSTIGQLRIYYNDGDTSQWVDAVNAQGIAGTNGTNGTNGLGVPLGGTIGQALVKLSATDNDTAWSTLTATSIGSTTVGSNFFTLDNPSAITFPRINANNTVSALDAASFRTAIGAGSGTVTSVGGTGTVSGLTLTGTITSTGNLTLGGTLAVTAANFASQTANTVLAAPNNAAGTPTFRNLTLEDLPDAWVKKAVKCATTANITLSGTQTIDGVAVVAGDRVLVKNQATAANNGIYVVAAGTWTRSLDADTSSELASGMVGVDQGTVNGGKTFDTDFKSTDTLGTTAMTWHRLVDDGSMALYYRKQGSTTLASSSTAQSWLGLTSGVTVAANTIYEFEGSFRLTTTGTTSRTEAVTFGLTTAVVGNMDYSVQRSTNSTTPTASQTVRANGPGVLTVTGAITTAQDVTYYMRGTVSFTTGGQFNPQYQFSVAPGGTSTVILGAFFKMTAIGTTGSNAINGTWA